MSTTRPFRRLPAPVAAVVVAACLALSGCGPVGAEDRVPDSDSRALDESAGSTTPSTQPADDATTAPEHIPATPNPACAPGDGKEVEDLPDVEIPAVSVPDFESPDQRLGDAVIPGVRVPGFDLPSVTVDAGCVIRYDAPGGCLGAVEIVGAELPGTQIPGASIPPVEVDGQVLYSGEQVTGEQVNGERVGGERVEQECQEQPDDGTDTYIPSVYRASLYRASLYRASLYRASLYRPSLCVDVDGSQECTASVSVPSVSVPSVSMASASVESASMPSRTLKGTDTTVREDETQQAYVTPAEVLFEFDKSEIKPAAVPTLQAIAAEIADAPAGSSITVEGHTDSQGTHAYNQTLSEARADAVATWLETSGGIDPSILTTRGYGESAPAASNDTPQGQAENRRVVITLRLP